MSSGVVGHWYDGRSSRSIETTLTLKDGDVLVVAGAEGPVEAAYAEVRISDRLGSAPRRIEFPGGGAFETPDNERVDHLIAAVRPSARPWLHHFETNRRYIALAIAVVLALGWATFRYGIPAASRLIAAGIPPAVLSTVGEQTFAGINRYGLQSSAIGAERRQSLAATFDAVVAATGLADAGCRVEFRAAPKTFGPNAFAIPPCLIVVTDELVELAANDDEIVAVLAHELGHIRHRHTMRRIVQDAFLTFIFMLMTGDTTQVSAAIATIPALFLELGYARNFEREADTFALEYLKTHGVPLHYFPDILHRMEAWRSTRPCKGSACEESGDGAQAGGVLDYLSTHPSTAERARLFAVPDGE